MLMQRQSLLIKIILIFFGFLLIGTLPLSSIISANGTAVTAAPVISEKDYINGAQPTYLEWLATKAKSIPIAPATERISISGGEYAAISDKGLFLTRNAGLVWEDAESWVDYQV